MPLLVVGSVALDSVETPHGVVENALGGSATFFSYAASFFTPVRLVGRRRRGLPRRAPRAARRPQGRHVGPGRREGGQDVPLEGPVPGGHEHGRDPGGPSQRPRHVQPRPLARVRRDARSSSSPTAAPPCSARCSRRRSKRKLAVADTMNFWIETQRDELYALLEGGRRPGAQRRRGPDAHRGGEPRPRRVQGARPRPEVRHHQEGRARGDVPERERDVRDARLPRGRRRRPDRRRRQLRRRVHGLPRLGRQDRPGRR